MKERVLTQNAFDKLLARFDSDAERAAREYELIRAKLVSLFRYRRCASPFDLADETIDRVARKIEDGEVIAGQELTNYFYGVARNVLREHLRSPETSASPIEELPPSNHPAEDPERILETAESRQKDERSAECLESCLDTLGAQTRELVVSYYRGEQGAKIRNRRRLAAQLGVSANSLRIRLHRIREKLESCVLECMKGGR